jgi:hypothetical protein
MDVPGGGHIRIIKTSVIQMKLYKIIILILVSASAAFGQKSVTSLKPAHAAALNNFLPAHKTLSFMSEAAIETAEPGYMKSVYKSFGKGFTPYYAVGDFNKDGIEDFGVILSREGTPKKNEGIDGGLGMDYPLELVVFNGDRKGNFTAVYTKDIDAPPLCFIRLNGGRKGRLLFGVFDSDIGAFELVAVGKGYKSVEYQGEELIAPKELKP